MNITDPSSSSPISSSGGAGTKTEIELEAENFQVPIGTENISTLTTGLKMPIDTNIRILYITFAVIIGLLILWIIIISISGNSTPDPTLSVLSSITDIQSQIPPVIDNNEIDESQPYFSYPGHLYYDSNTPPSESYIQPYENYDTDQGFRDY